jgi:hypothetical protein
VHQVSGLVLEVELNHVVLGLPLVGVVEVLVVTHCDLLLRVVD